MPGSTMFRHQTPDLRGRLVVLLLIHVFPSLPARDARVPVECHFHRLNRLLILVPPFFHVIYLFQPRHNQQNRRLSSVWIFPDQLVVEANYVHKSIAYTVNEEIDSLLLDQVLEILDRLL